MLYLNYCFHRIYVCDTDWGFDYAMARVHGYSGFAEFLGGKLQNQRNSFSWIGQRNVSWRSVKRQLFKEPMANFKVLTGGIIKPVRMFPLSCFEFSDVKHHIHINSKQPLVLYFTDANNQPSFYLVKTALTTDPVTLGLGKYPGESSYYEIKLAVTEKRLDDGSCTVYDKPAGYAACIDANLQKEMLEYLGCIPPWVIFNTEQEHNICKTKFELVGKEVEFAQYKLKELTQNVKFLTDGGFNFHHCHPPCSQTTVTTQLTSFAAGNWSGYHINLKFSDKVKVSKEVRSYDIFNLCVEIGSSLGLWLGLSAISVLDWSILSFQFGKTFILNKLSN